MEVCTTHSLIDLCVIRGGKSARSKKASAPPVPLRTPFDFSKLDQEEAEIDSLLEQRQAELKEFLIEKCPWTYVNFNDIKRLDMMKDQTIFAIRAQPGTKLEVPDPDTVRLLSFFVLISAEGWIHKKI